MWIAVTTMALLFASCTLLNRGVNPKTYSYRAEYALSDKSGHYHVVREVGLDKNKKFFVTKEQILPPNKNQKKVLEKVISMSKPGTFKGRPLLRPETSQYTVWFDGEKYFSQTRIDEDNKEMIVKLISPEKQWTGSKKVSFPERENHFCYFLQIIECAHYTGFIKKATQKKSKEMKLHIIWEGHPYIHEQYLIAENLFTPAILTYEEKVSDEEHRFSLSFDNQILLYFVSNLGQLTRKIWISQGYGLLKVK